MEPEFHTFYLIRATKDFIPDWIIGNPEDSKWYFKKGWYAARQWVKPFKDAKFFASELKAKQFLKQTSYIRAKEEHFEIVPINVYEPE